MNPKGKQPLQGKKVSQKPSGGGLEKKGGQERTAEPTVKNGTPVGEGGALGEAFDHVFRVEGRENGDGRKGLHEEFEKVQGAGLSRGGERGGGCLTKNRPRLSWGVTEPCGRTRVKNSPKRVTKKTRKVTPVRRRKPPLSRRKGGNVGGRRGERGGRWSGKPRRGPKPNAFSGQGNAYREGKKHLLNFEGSF